MNDSSNLKKTSWIIGSFVALSVSVAFAQDRPEPVTGIDFLTELFEPSPFANGEQRDVILSGCILTITIRTDAQCHTGGAGGTMTAARTTSIDLSAVSSVVFVKNNGRQSLNFIGQRSASEGSFSQSHEKCKGTVSSLSSSSGEVIALSQSTPQEANLHELKALVAICKNQGSNS